MTVNELDVLISVFNTDMEVRIIGKDCETGRLYTSGIKTYTIECATPLGKRTLLLNPDIDNGTFFDGKHLRSNP